MPSERIQRRIDAFLDQAEAASDASDWEEVAAKARAVLAMDPKNEDAPVLLRAAEANLGNSAALGPQLSGALASTHTPPADELDSFAGGRYVVRRFLGEGGKKRVYLAHDELLDRNVAFALIKIEGLDEVGRERIVREAQAMGRMGRMGVHPHIVSILDFGDHDGVPYVVTELMGGGDVEGLLEDAEGPLPLPQSLEIAKATDGLDDLLVLAANQFFVSALPSRDGSGFVISVGHVSPPILIGNTSEERLAHAKTIESILVKPIIRFSLTHELAQQLLRLLDAQITSAEERMAEEVKEMVDAAEQPDDADD